MPKKMTARNEQLKAAYYNPKIPQKHKTEKTMLQRMRWGKFLVCIFAVYFALNLFGGFFSIYELKKQHSEVSAQVDAARQEQEQLLQQIDYMATEPAIEKAAREKLGLVMPGEIMIVKVNDGDD